MAGTLDGACGPGSSDLLVTLAGGLDEAERVETMQIITRRLIAERAAAAGGQRERQVDVGTRNRASRRRAPGQAPTPTHPTKPSAATKPAGSATKSAEHRESAGRRGEGGSRGSRQGRQP
ncbi:hypothetical protein [Parafrankia sp. EUN1f]|uniref:hypothetical protein n=1 Tax=Parafrankia sp. EUN1f TaxID=102897 RepID=UPI0018DBAB4E|nr:hypothetical protein [Parafrankia sp. EUN1f]